VLGYKSGRSSRYACINCSHRPLEVEYLLSSETSGRDSRTGGPELAAKLFSVKDLRYACLNCILCYQDK
jgi:hypothetical protein